MAGWLVILIRSFVLFFLTLVLMRLLGKKGLSNMTTFQFINCIVIAILAALISINIIQNLAFGVISLLVWSLLPIALDYLCMKSKLFHDLVYGKQTILIKDGKIMEKNLSKARMTGEELLRTLHSRNIFNLADVEFAVMEYSGDINAVVKPDKKPITAHDLGRKVAPQTAPQTVILDGNIVNDSLAAAGLSRRYLESQLQGMGVTLDNVFIGQVDASGDLYLDIFNDVQQVPESNVKELLYANIEKCQADLMSFALETENQLAKQMFEQDAEKLKYIMKKLKPYLLH